MCLVRKHISCGNVERVVVSRDVIIIESSPKQIIDLPESIGIEVNCNKEDETLDNQRAVY